MILRRVMEGAVGEFVPEGLSIELAAQTAWNEFLLRKLGLPALYTIPGVHYQREDYSGPFPEDWRDAVAVVNARGGDCEDLATYRAAELRRAGEPAKAVFIENPHPRGRMFHILVLRGDGKTLEDPSRLLGMQRI